MKIVVVTDSTAYIPAQIRDNLAIHMIPLSVVFGHESYREEIDITADDFFTMVHNAEELPKTSQPALGEVIAKLEELSQTYDAVVAVHLSSGISGTYHTMQSAGNMVDGIDVYAFDSEVSCLAQGFYVLEAAEMASLPEMTPEKIIARLKEMKQTMRAYFMADDLSHLHRGGRLNGAQALIGSMLQVKPLLHFVDTKIVPFEKIRTRKKAVNRMFDLIGSDAQSGKTIKACVIHAKREQEAVQMKQELEQRYDNVEVTISYFGPVIGTHLGEGALGICWFIK
ncbi:DegV family protein [Radiobacillus sp. PE A8.2]|uniref:DegV family protein n=1 Tax=Radiobacillus sp. PE A8.2 TaxID=3380349 RepID=UPI00389073CE